MFKTYAEKVVQKYEEDSLKLLFQSSHNKSLDSWLQLQSKLNFFILHKYIFVPQIHRNSDRIGIQFIQQQFLRWLSWGSFQDIRLKKDATTLLYIPCYKCYIKFNIVPGNWQPKLAHCKSMDSFKGLSNQGWQHQLIFIKPFCFLKMEICPIYLQIFRGISKNCCWHP